MLMVDNIPKITPPVPMVFITDLPVTKGAVDIEVAWRGHIFVIITLDTN